MFLAVFVNIIIIIKKGLQCLININNGIRFVDTLKKISTAGCIYVLVSRS